MKYPELRLKAGKERALRFRHPWIFSGALQKIPSSLAAGTIVDLAAANGDFYGRGMFEGGSIAVKLLTFERENIDEDFLIKRLRAAIQARQRMGVQRSATTNAFRLIHGEGDYLPGLIVDLYDQVAVVHCQSLGMSALADSICSALKATLELDTIVLKTHEAAGGGKPRVVFGASTKGVLCENGARFVADFIMGQKTGFFLDQRNNRLKLRELVRDRRVLNAFCYSGGFTINALIGGAKRVDSVDSSASALELLQQNLELNGYAKDSSACGEVIEADCFKILPDISKHYDTIILDPPAFAKHRKDVTAAMRGYQFINATAIRGLPPGGLLLTFSCSQLVSQSDFWSTIQAAAAETGRQARVVATLGQAECHPISAYHPEGLYLKGLVVVVNDS